MIRACRGGHVETARVLLDHGAQVDLPVRCDVQKWIQGCGVLFGWAVFGIEWEGTVQAAPLPTYALTSNSTP